MNQQQWDDYWETQRLVRQVTQAIPAPPPASGLTRDDVLRAREAWKKHAPPAWRSLLDAPTVDEPRASPPTV